MPENKYRCIPESEGGCRRSCGRTFSEPSYRPKSTFRLLALTLRSLWDRNLSADDQFVPVCPYCGSDRIEAVAEEPEGKE